MRTATRHLLLRLLLLPCLLLLLHRSLAASPRPSARPRGTISEASTWPKRRGLGTP